MDRILARFGEVQEEYEHLGGYALESQAREVLHGLGFDDERIDGDVGALSGGWKMRVAMARVLLGRPDVLLMDEPTNHLDIESIVWLEAFLKPPHRRAAHDVARPRLHEPRGHQDRRDRRRRDHRSTPATTTSTSASGRCARPTARRPTRGSRRCSPRSSASSSASRARREGRAGAEPGQGARQDREDRAAEEARASCSSTSASRRDRAIRWPCSKTCTRPSAARVDLRRAVDLTIRRGERWCVMGRNGAGKTTLLKMVAGVLEAGRRRGEARREPEDGLLRAAVARAARSRPHRRGAAPEGLPARSHRRAAQPRSARSSSPATTSTRRSARSRAARRRGW